MVKQVAQTVVAGEGSLAHALVEALRSAGRDVVSTPVEGGEPIEGPVELLVIADEFDVPRRSAADVSREELATSLHRLTYAPYRLAVSLQPQLAEASGRVVLLSKASARMEWPDTSGRYLDRPFRAAAHALWRCMSVEWREQGVSAAIVASPEGWAPDKDRLLGMLDAPPDEAFPAELVDLDGKALGW